MTEVSHLAELKQGDKATVIKLNLKDSMRRRLQDIGLVEGTEVRCIGHSPLGDPTAFLIRGAVIALRREDSRKVMVQIHS